MTDQALMIPMTTEEHKRLEELARRRGFNTPDDYVRALVELDAEQHGEAAPFEADESDDPFESFKRGWDDAMNGHVMSREEFRRRMSEDVD